MLPTLHSFKRLRNDCWFEGKLWKLLKEEEACLTTKFNNFPNVQVKDLVLFQRFSMSQRTILVAQAAHFLDLIMKFKTSLVLRKTKLRKVEVAEIQAGNEQTV
ncbi:hypothetical protein Tco_0163145 [Tanacetum coccineum]